MTASPPPFPPPPGQPPFAAPPPGEPPFAPPPGEPPVEPVRSHRAPPGPIAKAGTGARVTALLIAALAVGAAIANWRPLDQSADERERPYVRTGTIGQQVPTRVFDATLLSARGAGKIGNRGQAYETGGVWIIVRVRLTATDKAATLGYAAVRDRRDRVYLATQRISQQLLGGRTLQPGIPVEGDLLFEVPRDAATDLTLLLAEPTIDHRMDAMAEITLPRADTATVDGWASASKPAILQSPKAGS